MELTLAQLIKKLNELVEKGCNPDLPVTIGHYTDLVGLIGDLELREVDWLFFSADDDDKPNYEREKVVELKCYEP